MVVGDTHVFPGFLTPVLTQIFFQNHKLLFSHASGEVGGGNTPESAGKKFNPNWVSNSQSPGRESDTPTTEPPGWGPAIPDHANLFILREFRARSICTSVQSDLALPFKMLCDQFLSIKPNPISLTN